MLSNHHLNFLPKMETIISSPSSFTPLLGRPKPHLSKPLQPKSLPISSSLKKPTLSSPIPSQNSFISCLQHALAAAALSLAINFCPVDPALASEFDVLNEGPPTETYVVDDAGVLSRVTKSDLKRLMSDLESRKNLHINFITVRKLTVCI